MSTPLISTVIACYNGADFLAEAIESALSQDYEPQEIIVVDDGSADSTAEIASGFEAVTLIRHESNRGVAAARNSALAAAHGEFIAVLDADDQMFPGRLRSQLEHLLSDPSLGCTLGLQEILISGEVARLPDWAEDRPKLNWRDEGPDAPLFCASSVMFPRPVLDVIGNYDESLRIGEDVDLIFRLTESGYEIGTLYQPVIKRRVHGNNLSGEEDSVLRALPALLSRRIARKRAASKS